MTQRLVDLYPVGTPVEITLDNGRLWLPALVVGHEFPAVWAQTPDGQIWFVTNARRIRRREDAT